MKDGILKNEFFMNGNTGISVLIKNLDRGKANILTENKLFIKNLEDISNFRGNILSISTSVESLLNSNIEFILFNVKDDSSELFQNLFLRTTHLTFFAKWNIFKELCKTSHKTKDNYDKKIVSSIQESIELRNNIAHGYLIYDYSIDNFYLEYYKNNKMKKDLIDDEYIESNIKKIYECINTIGILVYGEDTTIRNKMIK